MPAAIAVGIREEIVRRRQGKEKLRKIAQDMQVMEESNQIQMILMAFDREDHLSSISLPHKL